MPDLKQGTASPDELWYDYFTKRKPSPKDVSDLVYSLHAAKKHDHVIAAIQAALATGQSQPWMYDTLAMSMEIDGRPAEQVERVLLSRIDFTATDVPNLLYSAAFLTRLGAKKQALRLYRQASRLDETRPESYLLGLNLARELKDYDAIQWACTGTLTYAWTKDRKARHRQAEDAALVAEQELKKSRRNKEAEALRAAVKEARMRDLVLRLNWIGEGELDLKVQEPSGTVCSVENPITTGGGVHVHDGYGPKPEKCFEEYVCAKGLSGDYRAIIETIPESGNIVGKRCQLTIIRYLGSDKEVVRKLNVPLDKPRKVVRLSLHQGRRKQSGQAQTRERTNSPRMSRREIMAGLGPRRKGFGRENGNFRVPAGGFTAGVGFAPVIAMIPDGIMMTATAVVSADRRYVRIAVAPQFNTIVDVVNFTFLSTGGGGQGGQGGGGGQGTGGGGMP